MPRRWIGIAAFALLLAGIVTTWLVSWACAVVRPMDGWPNVFGTPRKQWHERGRMPQLRLMIDAGEVFVDRYGTAVSEHANIAPTWAQTLGPDDQWLLSAYPTLDTIQPNQYVPWPDRSKWRIPTWAALCDTNTRDLNIMTSAWGWPMLCLKGVERIQHLHKPDGTIAGTTSAFHGYWLAGGTPVRQRTTPAPRIRNLPLTPIWKGYLANSLFYAAVWLIIGLAATCSTRVARRTLRRRRGLCTRCAYDLKGLTPGTPCPECGQASTHAPPPVHLTT